MKIMANRKKYDNWFPSNKKKIRGWKRRVKAIEKWKEKNLKIDLERLNIDNRDYVKIWIDPFYRLIKRNPPNWFIRKIISEMKEILFSWNNDLKSVNKQYYLYLWLYEENFMNTQIVCAINEKIDFYRNTFEKSSELRKFPINKFKNEDFFDKLDFELAIDEDFIFENDIDYDSSYKSKVEKKAYRIDNYKIVDGTSQKIYRIKKGHIWLGKIKN